LPKPEGADFMNVIMIRSNSIDPDARLEKEAKTLADAGYTVTLLGWQRSGNAPPTENRSGYTIRRIKLMAPYGLKIIFYLPIWWTIEFFQLLKLDWDIAHASDLDTYIPALLAAKIKRKRVVYDIFDFYADEIILPAPIRNCIAKTDIFLMRFADAVIIVDPSRLKQIGKPEDSDVHILYNSPDDLVSSTVTSQRQKEAPFRIFFAGFLIPGRDFETIIEAGKEIGNIQIIIAGFGSLKDRLVSLANQESHVTFIGRIPYNEVIQRTLQSDLLFAFYDPGVPNNRYASPNKLFEAMMCGKPVLVNDGTSMADIVRKENCGLVVPYRDLNAIRQAILLLRDDPHLCIQLGANGRRAYEQEYGWKIMEDRLLALYQEIRN
jgi:glycosyltransferase involved in cell wall biosynthesis